MGPRSEGRLPIDVYPTYKLLKEQEDEWVKKGRVGVAWPRDSKDPKHEYTGPLTLPSFPQPYPTLPFSYRARRLKSFIPFQSLPSRVTVHDPWNLLAMSSPGSSLGETVTSAPGRSDDWISAKVDGKEVEDKIHSYKLRVIDDGMREMYEWYERVHPQQEWAVEELGRTMRGIEGGESGERGGWKVTWVREDEDGKEEDVRVYFKNAYIQLSTGYFPFLPSLTPSPTPTQIPPPIYLIHYPPPPPLPLSLPRRQPNFSGIRPLGENTHVYFTPAKKAGDGHHSRAYKVEWVMPRGVVYPRGEDGLTPVVGDDDEGNDGNDEEGGEEDYVLCKKCLLDDMWREIEILRASEASDNLRDELGTLTREEIPSSHSDSNLDSETAEEVDGNGEAGEKEEEETKEGKEKMNGKEKEEQKPSEEEEEDRKEDDSDADKSEDSWVEVSSNDVVGSSPKATSPVLPTDTSTLVDSDALPLPSLSSPPSSSEPGTAATPSSSDSSPSLPRVDSTPTEDDGKTKEKEDEKNKRYLYTYTGPLRSITVKTLYQDRMRPKCVHRDPLHSVPPPTSPPSTIPSSQADSSEAEGPFATIATTPSSLPTPPISVVPEMKVPSVSPTTTLRALAKLTYGPGYSPQCGHSGCSGSSSDHRRHMRREVWCYEWFGKDLRSGSDEDDGRDDDGGKGKDGKGKKRGGKDKEVDMFLHWGKKPRMRVKPKPTVEGKKENETKPVEPKEEDAKPAEGAIAEEVAPAPALVEETKKDSDDAQPAVPIITEDETKPAPIEESANSVGVANPTNETDDAQVPDVPPPAADVTPTDPPTEVKDGEAKKDEEGKVAEEVEPIAADGEDPPKEVEATKEVEVVDGKAAEGDEVKEEEAETKEPVVEETKDQEPKATDESKVEAEVPKVDSDEATEEVEVKDDVAEKEETPLVEGEVNPEPTEAAQPTDPPANPVVEAKEDTKAEAKEETALAKEAEVKQEATETVQPTDPTPVNPDTTDAPANPDTTDPPVNPEPTPIVDSGPTNGSEVKPADATEPNVDPPTEASPPTETSPPPVPAQAANAPPPTNPTPKVEELEYETDQDEEEGDIELGAILPRYYGYWVHDEECECRVVGREEVTKEDKKREGEVKGKEGEKQEAEEAEEEKLEEKEVKEEEKKGEKTDEEEVKKEDDIPKEGEAGKDSEMVEAKDDVKEDINPVVQEEKPTTVKVADPAPTKDEAPRPEPTTEDTVTVPALDAEKVDGVREEKEEDDIVMVEAGKEVDEDLLKNAEATAPETLPPPEAEVVEPPAEKPPAEAVVVEKAEVAREKVEEAKVIDGSGETKDIPTEQPKFEEPGETKVKETDTALDNIPPPDVTPDELSVDKKLEVGVSDEAKDEAVEEKKDEVVDATKEEEKKEVVVEEAKEEKKDEVVEEKKEEIIEKVEVAEAKEDEEKKEDVLEEQKDEVVEEKKDEEKKEEAVEEKKEEEPKKKEKGYFSDILLLENCGWPVDNIRLRTDEKKQIHSLFSRFHSYGWTHHSPWKRNVVYHWGPVNKHMGHRKTDRDNRQLSFRVIDFGRARYHAGYDGKGTPGVDWDDKYEDADDRKAKWERATKSEMGDVRDEFVL